MQTSEIFWFNVARHFGLQGGEVFTQLKCTDFECHVDEEGREYIVLKMYILIKNSKGGMNSCKFRTCGMISDKIQVQAMQWLVNQLNPLQDRPFQCVLTGIRPWALDLGLQNVFMGQNSPASMMELLSIRAKLSKRYVNHYVG